MTLRGGIDNIFDQDYQWTNTSLSEPGRSALNRNKFWFTGGDFGHHLFFLSQLTFSIADLVTSWWVEEPTKTVDDIEDQFSTAWLPSIRDDTLPSERKVNTYTKTPIL
ncbi:MAG: hypothetical protein AAF226_17690 [Verrucomicrobiota bacterium]